MRTRRAEWILHKLLAILLAAASAGYAQQWTPNADWAHWRLGHKSDLDFLTRNHLTITFGPGAPNFEQVTRAEFDAGMAKAKEFTGSYHAKGYIVLRYLSSSLNGTSDTPEAPPRKEQIHWRKFYDERWREFEDYIGPKPAEDPTSWITVRPDGTFPFYRYAPYGQKTGSGFETWGCPNNPSFVRMMEGRVRAQAECGIDGAYVDWTQIAGETCYCRHCRSSFLAYLERNLPRDAARAKYGKADYDQVVLPRKRGEPFWMEWISFRGHSVAEFHRRLRETARRYNPSFMISGNVYGGFGYGPIAYDAAGNIELLGRDGYDDFVYSEVQEFLDSAPRKDDSGAKITNSPALKFLAAVTHGKPVIVYATEITPPIFPNPTERCLSAMAQINIAEAVANHCVFREKRETPPGATEIYRFLAANEERLAGARMSANIGVVASIRQYLADELSFAFSASRVLADKGIAHVMIAEDDLLSPAALAPYELIIVPYLPLMSASHQEGLARFARSGGTLVLLGASGVKNEYNLPHARPPLAGLLGSGGYGRSEVTRRAGKGQVVYLPLLIPPSRFLIPLKARGEYTTFGPTMADVFPDIPHGYTRNNIDPGLRRELENMAGRVSSLLGARATRLVSGPAYVELTTMLEKNARRLLAHFVNYDVTLDGVITPARGMTAQVALPPGKTARSLAYSGSLGPMRQLRFDVVQQAGRQTLMFEPDETGIYGLGVIELE